MQTLQRKRCQTRARSRKKACVYGVRVLRATIFTYVDGNPLGFSDPNGLQAVMPGPGGVPIPVPVPPIGTPPSRPIDPDFPLPPPVDPYVPPIPPIGPPLPFKPIFDTINWCMNSAADCAKEWREAFATCRELIREQEEMDAGRRRRRSVKGVTGGYKDIQSCARGLVSETCGGNLVKR